MLIHTPKICEILNDRLGAEFYLAGARFLSARGELKITLAVKGVVSAKLKQDTEDALTDILPDYIKKIYLTLYRAYADADTLKEKTEEYISAHHSMVAALVRCAEVENADGKYTLKLCVDELVRGYAEANRLAGWLEERFARELFEDVGVYIEYGEVAKERELPEAAPVFVPMAPARRIRPSLSSRKALAGSLIEDDALYAEDAAPAESAVFCGRVQNLLKRVTKNQRLMYRFGVQDFTGSISALYFAKPGGPAEKKMDLLTDGEEVLVRGRLEQEDGSDSVLIVRAVTLCELPKDFKPAPLPEVPPSESYTKIFPQKLELAVQQDLFSAPERSPSKFFEGREFVAFDLETTGTNYDLDAIVEIAAVRIVDGKPQESFHTLVNPGRPIPAAATNVNNITDDMVADAPAFSEVVSDFYKFAHGTELVAHNIDFDIKFMRFAAKPYGYTFENRLHDTLSLARQKLKGLSNYKLETVAAHFGVDPGDKHRALSDTLTCAEVFMRIHNEYTD